MNSVLVEDMFDGWGSQGQSKMLFNKMTTKIVWLDCLLLGEVWYHTSLGSQVVLSKFDSCSSYVFFLRRFGYSCRCSLTTRRPRRLFDWMCDYLILGEVWLMTPVSSFTRVCFDLLLSSHMSYPRLRFLHPYIWHPKRTPSSNCVFTKAINTKTHCALPPCNNKPDWIEKGSIDFISHVEWHTICDWCWSGEFLILLLLLTSAGEV